MICNIAYLERCATYEWAMNKNSKNASGRYVVCDASKISKQKLDL